MVDVDSLSIVSFLSISRNCVSNLYMLIKSLPCPQMDIWRILRFFVGHHLYGAGQLGGGGLESDGL